MKNFEKLLPHAKFRWNRAIGCSVMATDRFSIWRPSRILNLKNIYIWSCGCHQVLNLLLCTKFYQNQMTFREDIVIRRFSRWRISATLKFRGPRIGSWKSPCKTYWSYIEIIALDCLVFAQNCVCCVRILAPNRRTDGQTDGHHQRVKLQTYE